MRRLAALALALAAACTLAACGGDDPRQRVEHYILQANAVQKRAAPAFERANKAYVAFSRRGRPDEVAKPQGAATGKPEEIAAAERAIRATRTRIARLRPPAEAAVLHRKLVRVFDVNVAMAHETTLLARYLPAAEKAVAPLNAISTRLRRRLAGAADPDHQARSLRAYFLSLDLLIARLRRLDVPPVLAPTHRAQTTRLTSARLLAKRLRDAIEAQDAKRVARLLVQFRKLNDSRDRERRLTARAIRDYTRRYRAITTVVQDAQRERLRLERKYD
ncbi:MAG: hypothetical protein QOE31_2575 [Solirubrobacteraceae bacterium]|nr:hypothetical protein [Solirubrobacteraceae bacterium]